MDPPDCEHPEALQKDPPVFRKTNKPTVPLLGADRRGNLRVLPPERSAPGGEPSALRIRPCGFSRPGRQQFRCRRRRRRHEAGYCERGFLALRQVDRRYIGDQHGDAVGADDVAGGVPCSNRVHQGVECSSVGYFRGVLAK